MSCRRETYSPRIALGFTLIEMLVAMTLVATISVAIIEALRFGQQAYDKVARSERASQDVQRAHRFLRRSLESAYPTRVAPLSTPGAAAFAGDDTRLEFVAAAPVVSRSDGLNRYEIMLTRNSDRAASRDLVVRWGPNSSVASLRDWRVSEEVLLSDVESIKWQYLERFQGSTGLRHGGSQWHNSWLGRSDLPAAVRLNVEFSGSVSRVWPELVAALRITNDSSCAFDVVAQACRAAR